MENNLQKINELHSSGRYAQCIFEVDTMLESPMADTLRARLLNLKGFCLSQQNEHNAAVACYVEAIKMDPLYPLPYANIADSHAKNLQFDEAKKYFELALTIDDNLPEAVAGLGVVAFQSHDYETAVKQFDRALELRPNDEMMLTNLGNTLAVQGEYDKALKILNQVITINPQNSMARTNRGLILLSRRDWARGWRDYEFRFDSGNFLGKKYQELPIWTGETPKSRDKVVIWAEQGLGDEIMFSTIFEDLQALKSTFLIECDRRLINIFKKSFPKLNFFTKQSNLRDQSPTHQIPLASLGLLFRERKSQFYPNPGHLTPPETPRFADQLAELRKSGKKILGVSWGSYALTSNFRLRKSIPAAQFEELLANFKDCTLINLQFSNPHKHEGQGSPEVIPSGLISLDGLDTLKDVEGVMSVLTQIDGTISIGNTLAHMAGSVGTPAVVLLPHVADWRWGEGGQETPWYKSVNLYRNNRPSWSEFLRTNGPTIKNKLIAVSRN